MNGQDRKDLNVILERMDQADKDRDLIKDKEEGFLPSKELLDSINKVEDIGKDFDFSKKYWIIAEFIFKNLN